MKLNSNQMQIQNQFTNIEQIEQEGIQSDSVVIPAPIKNAIHVFRIFLDITTGPSESQFKLYHGIFLEKNNQDMNHDNHNHNHNNRQYYNRTPDILVMTQFTDDISSRLSPCEMVLYFTLIGETSFGKINFQSNSNSNQEGSNTLPSFLIHFLGTISDPQISSITTHFLIRLLNQIKKCINSHPTEDDLLQISSTTDYEWKETKFKQFKTNAGILAYDLFCGAFDGLMKIFDIYTSIEKESKRLPFRNINPNINYETQATPTVTSTSSTTNETGKKMKETENENQHKIDKELKKLIWEPLIVDFIHLIQECTTLARIPFGGSYLFSFEDNENLTYDEIEDLESLRHRIYEWMSDLDISNSQILSSTTATGATTSTKLNTTSNYGGCIVLLDCIHELYTILLKLFSSTDLSSDSIDSIFLLKHRYG